MPPINSIYTKINMSQYYINPLMIFYSSVFCAFITNIASISCTLLFAFILYYYRNYKNFMRLILSNNKKKHSITYKMSQNASTTTCINLIELPNGSNLKYLFYSSAKSLYNLRLISCHNGIAARSINSDGVSINSPIKKRLHKCKRYSFQKWTAD